MTESYEFEKMWKEVVVAYFIVVSKQFSERIKEKNEMFGPSRRFCVPVAKCTISNVLDVTITAL
jgi:hypothetical protein